MADDDTDRRDTDRPPSGAPPDRRSGAPARAGSELRRILEQLFRQPRAERSLAVTAAWSRAVGPRIAQVARPIRIVDRKLLVQVTSPAWRQELSMQAREIVRKLQRELGDSVQSLDIRVGVNPELRSTDAAAEGANREPLPALRAVAGALESPELRAMALALADGRPLERPEAKRPGSVGRPAKRGTRKRGNP
ncbi:MAG: DUF721 domain-containing protein [Deltaproteobacteria bacterium]|nr:DUF721 domain-containing protein [Deltaproteobacteria bacterium]